MGAQARTRITFRPVPSTPAMPRPAVLLQIHCVLLMVGVSTRCVTGVRHNTPLVHPLWRVLHCASI